MGQDIGEEERITGRTPLWVNYAWSHERGSTQPRRATSLSTTGGVVSATPNGPSATNCGCFAMARLVLTPLVPAAAGRSKENAP